MELTKFDNFAICSDTVEGIHGDFTVTVLLDRDPDITPDHYDCYCDKTRQRWRDDEWFFGMLRAKVSVDVAGQTVVLDDCAASLGGVWRDRSMNGMRESAMSASPTPRWFGCQDAWTRPAGCSASTLGRLRQHACQPLRGILVAPQPQGKLLRSKSAAQR